MRAEPPNVHFMGKKRLRPGNGSRRKRRALGAVAPAVYESAAAPQPRGGALGAQRPQEEGRWGPSAPPKRGRGGARKKSSGQQQNGCRAESAGAASRGARRECRAVALEAQRPPKEGRCGPSAPPKRKSLRAAAPQSRGGRCGPSALRNRGAGGPAPCLNGGAGAQWPA